MGAGTPSPKRGRRGGRRASGGGSAPAGDTRSAPRGSRSHGGPARPSAARPGGPPPVDGADVVYGRNPVREVIVAGRRKVRHVWLLQGEAGRDLEHELSRLVARTGVALPPPSFVPPQDLVARAGSPDHQGVVVETDPYPYTPSTSALAQRDLLIALDRIQDPHNLGSIIRTAEEVGAGVVIPRHRTATVTPAVVKAAAGATEHATVVQVRNLTDFIGEAKQAGFWVYGAVATGSVVYDSADFTSRTLFVMGSEGEGLSERVAAACDVAIAVPLAGRVGSLNVGVAAAVLLFEAARQRRAR